MITEMDKATGDWTRAKAALKIAQTAARKCDKSDYLRNRLEMAEKEFNLCCLDRARAREKVFVR